MSGRMTVPDDRSIQKKHATRPTTEATVHKKTNNLFKDVEEKVHRASMRNMISNRLRLPARNLRGRNPATHPILRPSSFLVVTPMTKVLCLRVNRLKYHLI